MFIAKGSLRLVALVIALSQLVWVTSHAVQDLGLVGVVLSWVLFPLTLLVSPIWGSSHTVIGLAWCYLSGVLRASSRIKPSPAAKAWRTSAGRGCRATTPLALWIRITLADWPMELWQIVGHKPSRRSLIRLH
jgi:hypothetical protein